MTDSLGDAQRGNTDQLTGQRDASAKSPPGNREVARGAAASLLNTALSGVLQIAALTSLSRLLSPAEFGPYVALSSVIGLLNLTKDLGLGAAALQSKELTSLQQSRLFWLGLASSFLLSGGLALGAPALALFFSDARLTPLCWVASPLFLLSALGIQHRAYMLRRLRFVAVSRIELGSKIISLSVGIACAVQGASYWSLLAMTLAEASTRSLLLWLFSGWLPSRFWQTERVDHSLLRFGGLLSLTQLGNYVIRGIDDWLIGGVLGTTALGLYNRAYSLSYLPERYLNGPLTPVAVASLSQLRQYPERYRAFYCAGMELLAGLSFPIFLVLAMNTEDAVVTVLGVEWRGIVPILVGLLPAALATTLNVATGWVVLSQGQGERALKMTLVSAVVTLTCCLIGLRFGAAGVAWGISASLTLQRVPQLLYVYRGTPLGLGDLGRALLWPCIGTVGAGLTWLGCQPLLAGAIGWATLPSWLRLGLSLGVFFPVYAGIWLGLEAPRSRVVAAAAMIRQRA